MVPLVPAARRLPDPGQRVAGPRSEALRQMRGSAHSCRNPTVDRHDRSPKILNFICLKSIYPCGRSFKMSADWLAAQGPRHVS